MTEAHRRPFGRIILGLPHNTRDYGPVEVAAELARRLRVQCVGAFIVEPALLELGAIPGALELRSLATGWQPIESGGLARDVLLATDTARRKLADVSGRLNIDMAFHLAHGMTAEVIASLAGADDIVALIEPRNPADRITRQFLSFAEAAFCASSAVLLLPKQVARRDGPIVVVANIGAAVTIGAAGQLSEAMHEPLVAVDLKDGLISVEDQITAALANSRERMIVADRSMLSRSQFLALAGRRGVPLLVTGSQES